MAAFAPWVFHLRISDDADGRHNKQQYNADVGRKIQTHSRLILKKKPSITSISLKGIVRKEGIDSILMTAH